MLSQAALCCYHKALAERLARLRGPASSRPQLMNTLSTHTHTHIHHRIIAEGRLNNIMNKV